MKAEDFALSSHPWAKTI